MICATLKQALVFLFGCCKYMCTVLMSDCNILAFSNECALSINVRNEGENMCLLGECFHWDSVSSNHMSGQNRISQEKMLGGQITASQSVHLRRSNCVRI